MTAREAQAHARIERLASCCCGIADDLDRRTHIRTILVMLADRLALEILDGLGASA